MSATFGMSPSCLSDVHRKADFSTADQDAVLRDLLLALTDDDMTDIALLGCDGISVQANRFVLAARSPVLKRMLYGSFREAKSDTIHFEAYDSITLAAVVEYCCRNQLTQFLLYVHKTAISARRLVRLYQAADFFDLKGLSAIVAQLTHTTMSQNPALACAVYDEADPCTVIADDAWRLLVWRPYATLPEGIVHISAERVHQLFESDHVQAGELFLFQMLQKWVEHHVHSEATISSTGADSLLLHTSELDPVLENADQVSRNLAVAKVCAGCLQLSSMEPQDLLRFVAPSGLCTSAAITQAITQQALRASHQGVWRLTCRGRPNDTDRILVENAGTSDVNGMYYRIGGLANGELYSKREVACGQPYVYTLSVSSCGINVECRIFCSKLLTYRAIPRLVWHGWNGEHERSSSPSGSPNRSHHRRRVVVTSDPTFQPLLQVLPREAHDGISTAEDEGRNGKRRPKFVLSDGEHTMAATLASDLKASIRSKEVLLPNTLIKLLEYEKYMMDDGQFAIRMHKVSVVSQDREYRFGNPIYYYNDEDAVDQDTRRTKMQLAAASSPVVSPGGDSSQLYRDLLVGNPNCDQNKDDGLHQLYSCQYAKSASTPLEVIPRDGWEVDCHGCAPSPSCRWIAAQRAPSRSNSNNLTILATTSDIVDDYVETK